MGSLARFTGRLPKGGEQLRAQSLTMQEKVARSLGSHGVIVDETGEVALERLQQVATECECSVALVREVVRQFCWFREAARKVEKLKQAGKPMPTSMEEVEKMMAGAWSAKASQANTNATPGQEGRISRNASCPCGSGKKFKRCCGASN
eukprot:TRINITY_DN6420_c0_g2_i1.p2 TRINITY_DN6420_c0_g2~~TRINITY_DN6420_c0_g2_i1.p2  ORF type:complete len:149 (-),score=30.76 TRINITY_DN6420_c0_g2_i1:595-1041(-)